MSNTLTAFNSLDKVAIHLREKLRDKKCLLLFAYNGIGKTRLSMEFKNAGKNKGNADTLYFNAFTEDLFSWDNDLDNDTQRVLKLNSNSRFFAGLKDLEMDTRIRFFLHRYADFDFTIDYPNPEKPEKNAKVSFSREIKNEEGSETIDNIKVSRGEENIFIWCFFLAIVQLAIDEQETYNWVKYIYIDDPISSLDDNNVIAVASHLAQLLKKQNVVKTIISSHHTLFFNVICNELSKAIKYMLCKHDGRAKYTLTNTRDTPYFHHVGTLKELHRVARKGDLYTYHFSILRNILEKTATFHGFNNFSACIKQDNDDPEGIVHARMINVLSHGNYSLFEPMEMVDENKQYFKKILHDFMTNYRFNPELFPERTVEEAAPS